jgi:hypothetical protein
MINVQIIAKKSIVSMRSHPTDPIISWRTQLISQLFGLAVAILTNHYRRARSFGMLVVCWREANFEKADAILPGR